jgi:hypothetical protein
MTDADEHVDSPVIPKSLELGEKNGRHRNQLNGPACERGSSDRRLDSSSPNKT